MSRSGRKGVARAPRNAMGGAAPKARSRRAVTVRGKKRPEGAAEASGASGEEGKEAPLSAEVPGKRKRGRPTKEDAKLMRENQNRGQRLALLSSSSTSPDWRERDIQTDRDSR